MENEIFNQSGNGEAGRADFRILAEGHYALNNDLESRLNNNDLIIGGSGSGKTGGYVVPNLRCPYGSFLVMDTKGQLWKMLAPGLRRQGYEVRLLDFVEPERSQGYNPLDYLRPVRDRKRLEHFNCRDITSLATLMVPDLEGDKDPFWRNNARTVLTFLLSFTMEALPPEERCLASVAELYRCISSQDSLKRMQLWCSMHPGSFTDRKYRMFAEVIRSDRTWACIEQFVAEALDIYDLPEAAPIFGSRKACIDLHSIGRKKTAVFVNVSDTDRYADRMVSLFYSQAMQVLCRDADQMPDGRLPVPVRFLMDDFASSVYIENFDRIISVIRSRNISASVILQSLPQLETRYSHAQAQTIVTNCDHVLYLGGQDLDTAEYIGNRVGRTADHVLLLPDDKAYLLVRGRRGEMVDRVTPYGIHAQLQPQEPLPGPGAEEEFLCPGR